MNDLYIDLSILETEPAEEYHAKAGKYLSSHQLLDFMACPWLYRKKQLGLIQDPRNNDTSAMLIGRAAHVRILEGRDAYESQFAIGGPINPKTGKPYGANTQACREWAEAQGKPVLSHDNVELIEQMASGVAMNDEAVDLLLYGRSEGVVRTTYCGTPCQIRIDWVHPHRGIVDLKTTADLTWFEAETKRRRYHNQLAFYQGVLAQVIGELVPCYLIGVEKIEPYRAGSWRLDEAVLSDCRRENEAAMERMKVCQRMDHWPTGYEQQRVLLL
ncbi:MAG: PD-(D/E)XK nuclease-like domain-containing protein [Phycisphaeraceae bacterium]|nr:PD-(D/E)XK nuclease-like domain-containing protein [Phycisphaeraceae bacterium]